MDSNTIIKKFFNRQDIRECLKNKNFDYIYNFLALQQDMDLICRISEIFLHKIGINPLKYLGYVPEYFLYNSGTVQNIEIPNKVVGIRPFSFYGCTNLVNVDMSENIRIIGDEAFSECKSLQSIVLPDSIEQIGRRAFSDCDNLKSITIGSSINKLAPYCFSACPNLETIIFNGTKGHYKKVMGSKRLHFEKPVTVKCSDQTFVEEITKG